MMNNLLTVNTQVVGLVRNRIRRTQQGYWILPLVDYNKLLIVVVIPDTLLLPEAGRMLMSQHHMSQGYPINSKASGVCEKIIHQNCCILTHGSNSKFRINFPITNTSYNVPLVTTPERLQELL